MNICGQINIKYKGQGKFVKYELSLYHPYPNRVHIDLFNRKGRRISFHCEGAGKPWHCGVLNVNMPDDYREILYAELTRVHKEVLARIGEIAHDHRLIDKR